MFIALLLIIYYLPFTPYHLLLIIYFIALLLIIYYLPFTTYHILLIIYSLSYTPYHLLYCFATYHLLYSDKAARTGSFSKRDHAGAAGALLDELLRRWFAFSYYRMCSLTILLDELLRRWFVFSYYRMCSLTILLDELLRHWLQLYSTLLNFTQIYSTFLNLTPKASRQPLNPHPSTLKPQSSTL